MIEYKQGDLLSVNSGIIVHGANAQGVMGSGVAKAIREKYPECYDTYHTEHISYGLRLGDVVWWASNDSTVLSDTLFIANGITQNLYGTDKRHVNYVAVADVFKEVIRQAKSTGLEVNFPKVGAGLGGGRWEIIEEIINDCDPEDRVKKTCWIL